jgi:hypothetical protein
VGDAAEVTVVMVEVMEDETVVVIVMDGTLMEVDVMVANNSGADPWSAESEGGDTDMRLKL